MTIILQVIEWLTIPRPPAYVYWPRWAGVWLSLIIDAVVHYAPITPSDFKYAYNFENFFEGAGSALRHW